MIPPHKPPSPGVTQTQKPKLITGEKFCASKNVQMRASILLVKIFVSQVQGCEGVWLHIKRATFKMDSPIGLKF